MIKKIDIAGIQLDNYTVREAIMMSEKMLSNNEFNTIEEVGIETLKWAERETRVKEMLLSLDNTIISDVGILRAVDNVSMQRKHEIEDRDFFYELLKRIERNHKNVYILCANENERNTIIEYINNEFSRIEIVGSQIIEDGWQSVEKIVNEINSTGVDVIMSVLSSPNQELFLAECKGMLSANLWYGASLDNFTARKKGLKYLIHHMVDVHRLALHINNYEEQGK